MADSELHGKEHVLCPLITTFLQSTSTDCLLCPWFIFIANFHVLHLLSPQVPGTTHVNVVCLFTASRAALEVIYSIGANEGTEASATQVAQQVHTPGHPHHSHPHSQSHSKAHSPTQPHKKSVSKKHRHPSDSSPSTFASPKQTYSWANSLLRFYTGDDAYRNRTFKLFPRMVKASWAIQAAVGTKPALIGNKKLELKYFRGPGYFEVDIDLSSSTIATHILGMVSAFCILYFVSSVICILSFHVSAESV